MLLSQASPGRQKDRGSTAIGFLVGAADGSAVGTFVGGKVGTFVGADVGGTVGGEVGPDVGCDEKGGGCRSRSRFQDVGSEK